MPGNLSSKERARGFAKRKEWTLSSDCLFDCGFRWMFNKRGFLNYDSSRGKVWW
ncbi:hypothetical protein CCACVL1_02264 [Corchorus capsularis]|uniref:Uncharacterized protein n=1 Tax=Corchorus capsularis TaxID=210143 RepID=A0A1R3K9N0_COCAP|nr:hypothetical protein CCACVL1_02264 [Corchorus capsularis]